MINITQTAAAAANEIADIMRRIDETGVRRLIQMTLAAKKVYFAGAGRSLLALRCVAMRFMHVGLEAYVVGDTTTPAFEPDDLLIAGSGSGETTGLITIVTKAKKINGKAALISTRSQSTLSSLCDLVILIPAYTGTADSGPVKQPILPGGTMFEESMLLLGDTMILQLGKEKGVAMDTYFSRHANLE
ncbi:MAG: 6-phospho-3-hexuloisomerase [Spirochaetaceae bacterium]|jgi:6-phospho-3-hexuloisomerase|nr:6-phospho-3-hexuloisomerase [Spirochaetaceae bacterium]